MDSYDPRLHPSHSADPPAEYHRGYDRDHRDRRPPPPRSRHDDFPYSDRAVVREHQDREHRDRDLRDHRAALPDYHSRAREASDWRSVQGHSAPSRGTHHHRSDAYRDRAHGDEGLDRYGRDARHMDDRHRWAGSGRERDRGPVGHLDRDLHVMEHSRQAHERHHWDHDRHQHQEGDHRRSSEYHGSDRRVAAAREHRPESSTTVSMEATNVPPPPRLETNPTSQSNPLASPTAASSATRSGPPPLPSELHALAEQGPMLRQAELGATKALSRQLPPSLMPDLLQDVDEILDLLLPVVLQSNQTGDVDQVVATLESRVKSQLKMARFTTKHLKTLREHPMLSSVLDPVIDSEVRRVAEGFKGA